MKLLHINASPRGEKSRTLSISAEYLREIKAKHPDITVDEINLFDANLPEIRNGAVDAKYLQMMGGELDAETKASWDQIAKIATDFVSYDMYMVSNPMWNFTVPYKLKHYIDVIMQPGILFRFTETGI